uniref:Uncharacterized protein n=1 Tax=Sarcophilus harrisii TaxID=9305 RepID=A0A7N4NPF3_SARHA
MSPSPFLAVTAFVVTVSLRVGDMVLILMLAFSGSPIERACKFTSVVSPKFSTIVKTLSKPSSSLMYTTTLASCQR